MQHCRCCTHEHMMHYLADLRLMLYVTTCIVIHAQTMHMHNMSIIRHGKGALFGDNILPFLTDVYAHRSDELNGGVH